MAQKYIYAVMETRVHESRESVGYFSTLEKAEVYCRSLNAKNRDRTYHWFDVDTYKLDQERYVG